MRTTRAYIASAGTAAVMLGASLCVFVVVSAFVAFGSWPGATAHESVDQLLLRDVVAQAKPKKVAVRSDAVVVARQTTQRAARRAARHPAEVVARAPAGTPVAQAPAGRGAPAASGPAASSPPSSPATPVQQQAQDVTKTVDNTTTKVTTPVQQQVQNVQTQVNEVVGAIGAPQTGGGGGGVVNDVTTGVDNVTTGVTNVTTGVTNGVKDATGSLLGH